MDFTISVVVIIIITVVVVGLFESYVFCKTKSNLKQSLKSS